MISDPMSIDYGIDFGSFKKNNNNSNANAYNVNRMPFYF